VLYERKHWQRYTTTRSRGKGSGKTQAVGARRRQAGRLERKTSSVALARGNFHRIFAIVMTNYDKMHKPQALG